MPVVDTPVHEKVREKEGAVYGCWNKPRPKQGDMVRSAYSGEEWPYVMSEPCMYDKSLSDSKCNVCQFAGTGETNDAKVRANGT